MNRRAPILLVSLILASAALAACGGAASPSTTPSPVPSASPTPVPSASPTPGGPGFALNESPAGLGCDAMRPPYDEIVFRIDPEADEPVTAIADTGAVLATYWSAGFVGGTADDPVVRDAAGEVVVSDGDTLVIPEAEWPRLHGYFVCPANDAVYVLEVDPS